MYVPAESLHELIKALQYGSILKSPKCISAMLQVDRANFVLPDDLNNAYFDTPLSIGYHATISAPHMHAYALELLQSVLIPGNKVLDVGSGSGIFCALSSKLMNDQGTVYGIEHIKEICCFSIQNINKHNKQLIESQIINIIEGDGRNGYPDKAPYNCIHVGAASSVIPQSLIEQLALGGIMMIPYGPENNVQKIVIVTKSSDGSITSKQLFGVGYVPLTSKENQLNK